MFKCEILVFGKYIELALKFDRIGKIVVEFVAVKEFHVFYDVIKFELVNLKLQQIGVLFKIEL